MLLMIILFFALSAILLIFLISKIFYTYNKSKKVQQDEFKIDYVDIKFKDYENVDNEGVTSSVYLGEGLFMTEQEYEQYRNKILNNCLRSFDEKIN